MLLIGFDLVHISLYISSNYIYESLYIDIITTFLFEASEGATFGWNGHWQGLFVTSEGEKRSKTFYI